MDAVPQIVGRELVIALFGGWPDFHDAEVMRLGLERPAGGVTGGPSLEAALLTCDVSSEVGSDGFYRVRSRALVQLRFVDVADVSIEGFNGKNVVDCLSFAPVSEPRGALQGWRVSFDPCYGFQATFTCRQIEVAAVTPCDEQGRPARG